MDLVDMIVPVFVALISAWRIAVSQNKRMVREENERETLKAENRRLEKQMADFKVITDELRKQLQQLAAYKELYERLSEAHDRLNDAHNRLTKDYNELNKRVETLSKKIAELSEALEKSRKNEDALKKRLTDLEGENATLKTSVLVYQDSLSRVGETTQAIEKLIAVLQAANNEKPKGKKPKEAENVGH